MRIAAGDVERVTRQCRVDNQIGALDVEKKKNVNFECLKAGEEL